MFMSCHLASRRFCVAVMKCAFIVEENTYTCSLQGAWMKLRYPDVERGGQDHQQWKQLPITGGAAFWLGMGAYAQGQSNCGGQVGQTQVRGTTYMLAHMGSHMLLAGWIVKISGIENTVMLWNTTSIHHLWRRVCVTISHCLCQMIFAHIWEEQHACPECWYERGKTMERESDRRQFGCTLEWWLPVGSR